MRALHAAALRGKRPCQRPGCTNMGRLRLKSNGRRKPRAIYLCADCFDSLQVYQLYELFLQFGRDLDRDSATIFGISREQ